MGVRFARTHAADLPDGAAVAEDLRRQLEPEPPRLAGVFAPTTEALDAAARDLRHALPEAAVIGSSTAGQFSDRGEQDGTIVAWAIAGDVHARSQIATGLGTDPTGAVDSVLCGLDAADPPRGHRTALVLLDPLAGNGEEATLMLANQLGPAVKLAGGAAADHFAMAHTAVAGGERVAEDALVIAVLDTASPVGIGVRHGHRPLSAPLTVTRAERNVVHEIEGRPAWDVWVEQTRQRASALGIDPAALETRSAVFDFLNRFEAGLSLGDAYKLRVPLRRRPEGSIEFACGVPEGTVLRIMESEHESQIASAGRAASEACARIGGSEAVAGALVFDCSCRKTILKDDFHRGVGAIGEVLGGRPFAGYETYGEIAMDPEATSGFHNTTTVVLALPA